MTFTKIFTVFYLIIFMSTIGHGQDGNGDSTMTDCDSSKTIFDFNKSNSIYNVYKFQDHHDSNLLFNYEWSRTFGEHTFHMNHKLVETVVHKFCLDVGVNSLDLPIQIATDRIPIRIIEDDDKMKKLQVSDLLIEKLQNTGYLDYKRRNVFLLDLSQDFLIPAFNEDRDFTMGLDFVWIGEYKWYSTFGMSPLHGLLEGYVERENDTLLRKDFIVGFSAFTPLDLASVEPVTDDRPYAATLYFRSNRLYQMGWKAGNGHKWFRNSSLGIGVLGGFSGNILAKGLQTGIHSVMRATSKNPNSLREDPMGWHNQVANKGIPYIQIDQKIFYSMRYKSLLELRPSAGVGAGMLYNYLNAGAFLKIGCLKHEMYDLTMNHHRYDYKLEDLKSMYRHGFAYLFVNANVDFWIHNATLQGVYIMNNNDAFRIKDDQMRRWVGHLEIGTVFKIPCIKKIFHFSANWRSHQITFSDRNHVWGRLSIFFI